MLFVAVLFAPLPLHTGANNFDTLRRSLTEAYSGMFGQGSEAQELPAALRDKSMQAEERKQLFIGTLLPIVLTENERLRTKRHDMLALLARIESGATLSPSDQGWLRSLASDYRVDGDPVTDVDAQRTLRRRIDVIPAELALAQAALESGWGRSVYARAHRDPFGMQGIVRKDPSQPKFESLRDSVRTYLRTLNSHPAYQKLRIIRSRLRKQGKPLEGQLLAAGLTRYSELGQGYVEKVVAVLRSNDFKRLAAANTIHRDRDAA